MKRVISIVLLTLCAALSYALDVKCEDKNHKATQVVNGKDILFIFRDEIEMLSTVGPVDWYDIDGTLVASNAEDVFLDEGCYRVNGSKFCVELYHAVENLTLTVEPYCESTLLQVSGNMGSRARTYSLSYNELNWNGEMWVDSAVEQTGTLAPTIYLPALYGATPIHLKYDAEILEKLEMDSLYADTELAIGDVVAVNMELTSLVEKRGTEGEKSNEINRPTSQDLITRPEYSGALTVQFFANPTPAARFVGWTIYKPDDTKEQRVNQNTLREIFDKSGVYKVLCAVSSDSCTCDSSEVTVQISASYLNVPNVFTPNGDGQNDEFRVAYTSLKQYHIWVYNRWGKLVYESDDPAKGWDGMIGRRKAAEGAYFYVIRALGTDAPTDAKFMPKGSYNRKKQKDATSVIGVYQLSGDINLLR